MKKIILFVCALFLLTGCTRRIGGNDHIVISVKALNARATRGGYNYKVVMESTNIDWKSEGTYIGNRKVMFTNKLYVVGDTIHIK